MHKNFSLTQNMQIPQGMESTGTNFSINLDDEIEKLSKIYGIHKTQQIKDFLIDNVELIPYIDTIAPIIDNHFPNCKKCMTFCKDPEFDELDDITIFLGSLKDEFDNDWKKLDKLEKELFYLSEFSTKIKGLISVDLWLN